jgi:type II secretion system protein H
MNRNRPSSRRAFTLIELMLVLLVIAIALGTVAPSLRGHSRTSRLRDTAEQFVTLTRLARTRAISTGQPHRVVIDAAKRRCVLAVQTVQSGQQFNEIQGEGDDTEFLWPDRVTVRMVEAPGGPRDFIDFMPTGRGQAAKVRVSDDDDGESVDVECATPTESFHVLKSWEASR